MTTTNQPAPEAFYAVQDEPARPGELYIGRVYADRRSIDAYVPLHGDGTIRYISPRRIFGTLAGAKAYVHRHYTEESKRFRRLAEEFSPEHCPCVH